ncbi:MAG: hypothetical protein WC565_09190 [Parcubacteria group bacterium]
MTEADIPRGLRTPKTRGSEEELQRRIELTNRNTQHIQECRRQLSDVLTGIDDRSIIECPNVGTIIIDGISNEQRDRIVRVGKERRLIRGSMDDVPTELIE